MKKKKLLIYLKLFQLLNLCSDKVFLQKFMDNLTFKVEIYKLETFVPKVNPKS